MRRTSRPATPLAGGPVAVLHVHWLVVLLVATQFVIAILMPDIGPKTVPDR